MIGIIVLFSISACAIFLLKPKIEERINSIRLKNAIQACGLTCSEINSQSGIHFTRYTINLCKDLSFLEFHKLSKPLCRYLKTQCVAYKEENRYIVDINSSRRLNYLDNLWSQTNYYNIFDFKGGKILINVFNNIMLVDVKKDFFVNSIQNYTTECSVREDLSVEDVMCIINERKHKPYRTRRILDEDHGVMHDSLFVIFNQIDDNDIDFILKYGKEVNVYVILIANQKVINKYGLKVNYIFYHGNMMEKYNISQIVPVLPVNFSEYTSDVYVCNRTFGNRVCIL